MVRTKVFVGNLSFTTKENELAKEFEVAGKVISANIITRGPRSLGYGFVEMENEADANNAVKLLDKKEIDGRPINVEVAKLRDETAPAQGQGQDANAQGGATRGGASRGRGPRRGRGGLRAQGQDGQGQQGQQQGGQQRQQGGQQGQQQDQQGASRGARRGNSTRGQSTRGTGAPRAARPPRPEGEETRTPSTTTLFVANLPFALEDEGFSKVLKDASLAYKTAHVVKKKTGKSKGFGFIEFDTEADQQKALNALNNKDVEGRPLAVKVALTGGQRTEGSADAKPATTTPTATTPAKPTTTAASPAVEVKKEDKPATPKQEQKK